LLFWQLIFGNDMKSTLLSHRGYHGSIEPSVRDGRLKGHILFIDDMITYGAATIPELQKAFNAAVDGYLADCARHGKFPQRPFKGQFNVRITPALHQTAVLHAESEGTSLNNVVVQALRTYLEDSEQGQQPDQVALDTDRNSQTTPSEELTQAEAA
jgi:predicted HicB family RNase H-like nuclease